MITKYVSLLNQYEAQEVGNFFQLYRINNMQYIVYSPSENNVSCIELFTFTDITPFQLSILTNNESLEDIEDQEMIFEFSCTKQDLINFIFDIEKVNDDHSYTPYISQKGGVLLYETSTLTKMRNIIDNENNLIFDNSLCYTYFVKDDDKDRYFICFNPTTYTTLLNDNDVQGTVFLMGSATPLTLSKAYDEKKQINIVLGRDYLKSLFAFAFFLNTKNDNNLINIECVDNIVNVYFNNNYKDLEDIINLSSMADNKLREMLQHNEIGSQYSFCNFCNSTVISFRESDALMKCFFLVLSKEFNEETNLIF